MLKLFSVKKIDKTKLQLLVDEFVLKCWEDNQGLRRQFVLRLAKHLPPNQAPKEVSNCEIESWKKLWEVKQEMLEKPMKIKSRN